MRGIAQPRTGRETPENTILRNGLIRGNGAPTWSRIGAGSGNFTGAKIGVGNSIRITAYNFAKHRKSLRWNTAFEAIWDAWTEDPKPSIINRA